MSQQTAMVLKLQNQVSLQHISRSAALRGLLLLSISLFCSVSQAAIIRTAPCGPLQAFDCITGIEGLEIDGGAYSMSVVVGTFRDLFPDPQLTLLTWGDQSFTRRASFAVKDALNAPDPNIGSDTHKFTDIPWWISSIHNRLFLPASDTGVPFEGLGYFDGDVVFLEPSGADNSGIGRVPPDHFGAFGVLSYLPLPSTAWLLGVAFTVLWRTRVSVREA